MGESREPWRLGHRPALDGLRGLAVLLVLADHAGFLASGNGSIGVTIFFVLSGFLISRLIIEARAEGRWSLRRFYANRAVRLVPALLLMLTVTASIMLAVGFSLPFVVRNLWPPLLYVQNFVPATSYAIFQHTWSLGVEEQFYWLWPLALPLLIRSRRRALWLAAAITVSVLLALTAVEEGASPLHFFTVAAFGHAYGLLAGGALALAAERLPRAPRATTFVGCAGIVAALSLGAVLGEDAMAPRVVAVPFALLLVWRSLDGGVLAVRPLRFMGRISYAVYLWHLPLLGLTSTNQARLDAVPAILATLVIATGSTLLFEEPLRRAWRRRGLLVRPEVDDLVEQLRGGVHGHRDAGGGRVGAEDQPDHHVPA